METSESLFATLRAASIRGWAIVEYNTADLRDRRQLPITPRRYRGAARPVELRRALHLADGVERLQRASSPGSRATSPYTAWRNTPFEDAPRDFLLAHADVPLGTRCGPSARRVHADADGWTAGSGTLALGNGYLAVTPDSNARVVLLSPRGLPATTQRAEQIVVGLPPDSRLRRIRVQGRTSPESGWETLADASGAAMRATDAGLAIARTAGPRTVAFDQLRFELTFTADTARRITRIAIL